jgi:ABC-type oligopeptide transport system ATPase subunit
MAAERVPLVQVRHLKKYFPITRGVIFQRRIGDVKAVDDVSFDIYKGETLGLVGEPVAGKPRSGAPSCASMSRQRGRLFLMGWTF